LPSEKDFVIKNKRLTAESAEDAENNKNGKTQETSDFFEFCLLNDLIPLGAGRSLRALR